ncbi:MAG: hypothetical protein JKY95_00570 [Planctomycetaceae bacterium]|nr:hypothetical protein [Planctomycetaceae bacterium]
MTLKLYIHRYAFAFIVMLVVIAQSAPLQGQENTNDPDGENKVVSPGSLSPETASPVPSRIKQDIIYLPDSEGHLQPVPLGTSLKNYLDWLDQGDTLRKSEQPAAVIQNLVCQGNIQYSANRDPWAFLTCQMEIDVQNSPQWQFQLLDMKEATLSGMTENGIQPQPEDLLITREDQNNQLILWYRNRDKINVTVNLMVPIRLTGEQNQLTLSVPAASRTELQLQTNSKEIQFHLRSNGFEEVEQNDQGDQITIKGFNQLIDFSWAPYREESDMSPVFNVDTQIELKRATESSTITARQFLTMKQGKLSSIVIQIPSSFAIDEVLMADTPIPHSIGTDRSLVTLNFQQPIETNAQIDWTLSAPIRKFEFELILNGFVVKEAKTQTGKIGILKSNDWRIGQNPADSKNIYQMSVRDLNREGEYSQAFRYYGQPFQLALATQRVQAQYTLETFYDLLAKKDSLELRVDFEITPRNRTLDAVLLQWPDLDSGLWTIEKVVQNSTGQEIKWGFDKNNSRSQLLELTNWDKKDFIHLVASRSIPEETAGQVANKVKLPISLPQISTTNSRHGPQNLRITSAPGPYQLIIEGQGIEEMDRENVPPSLRTRTLYSDQPEQHAHQNWYAITNPQHKMNINVVEIKRTVQCKSNLQILRIDSAQKKISYQQVFNFNIFNLPLNQIVLRRQHTLSVGLTIAEQQSGASEFIFEDQNGNRLQVEYSVETPLTTKDDDIQLTDEFFTVTFEQPVLGEYILILKGESSIDKLSDTGLFKATLPLLTPTQTNLFQLELSNQSAYQITPTNKSWEPQLPEVPNTNIPHWQDTSSSQSLDF